MFTFGANFTSVINTLPMNLLKPCLSFFKFLFKLIVINFIFNFFNWLFSFFSKMSIGNVKVHRNFYDQGRKYWSNIESTVNGMLGGFSDLSDTDIKSSRKFLNQFFTPLNNGHNQDVKEIKNQEKKKNKENKKSEKREKRALDCGSGIGRVTKLLLIDYFDKIDLLDVTQSFLDQSKSYFGEDIFNSKIGYCFCNYIHKFKPYEKIKYDLIWCQWVTGHLTDDHFVDFLKLAKLLLKPNGVIVIKDNHTSSNSVDNDIKDSSVVRPQWLFKSIFKQADLEVISERRQYNFPKGI